MIELFPIKSDADYQKALLLLETAHPGNKSEEEKIEILSQLVDLWKKNHTEPLRKLSPGEALREITLSKQINQHEVATVLGTASSNVSALLSGRKRQPVQSETFERLYCPTSV